MFLDVGFDMIVKGVWSVIISSVFISVYFDIRKSQELLEYDSKYVCYVCHLDRDVFLKYKLNFVKHIKNEHNVLNYMYFIMYILTKNPHNLSKIERYALDKFRVNDLFWLPSQDTIILQNMITKIKEKNAFVTTEYK